jgi:RNA polymerase sigma-70 factor (ECF subfamily)
MFTKMETETRRSDDVMRESREPHSIPLQELIRACAESNDPETWEELIRRVHPVIASTIVRTVGRFKGSSRSVVDDLVQETYVRMCAHGCRLIREFHADTPEAIFGCLKTVAFNVTMDYFRGKTASKRGSATPEYSIDTVLESVIPTGEAGATPASMERQILLDQIDRHLTKVQVRPTEQRIFWLYYRHGMTARAIASIAGIGLTQKGVESAIHRVTDVVRSWLVVLEKSAPAQSREGKAASNPFST